MPRARRTDYHIPSVEVFVNYWNEPSDLFSKDFDTILNNLVDAAGLIASKEGVSLSTNATANTRGRWYEWLIALGFRAWKKTTGSSINLVKLPNRSAIHAYDNLLQPIYAEKVASLRDRLTRSNMSLVTSNPDFLVVADITKEDNTASPSTSAPISASMIEEIDAEYQRYIGRCRPDQIIGYLAAKTSTRPDRRLQMVHEASIYKAVARYAAFSQDLQEHKLCFWAFAKTLNSSDVNALQSVAVHTLGYDKPEKAIDQIFQVGDFISLQKALRQILIEIET